MDHILVGVRITGLVDYVPSQSLKHRIDKLDPELRLTIGWIAVGVGVLLKPGDKMDDLFRGLLICGCHRDVDTAARCEKLGHFTTILDPGKENRPRLGLGEVTDVL